MSKIVLSKIYAVVFLVMMSMSIEADTVTKKKLPPCKDTPNCVSSQAPDRPHYIEPFKISGDAKLAWQAFRQAIFSHDRMTLTHETETSLHAEARTLVLRFVDDIDAFLDADKGVIHIRSASRLGHTDFGVNRKRLEEIREKLRKSHVLA